MGGGEPTRHDPARAIGMVGKMTCDWLTNLRAHESVDVGRWAAVPLLPACVCFVYRTHAPPYLQSFLVIHYWLSYMSLISFATGR